VPICETFGALTTSGFGGRHLDLEKLLIAFNSADVNFSPFVTANQLLLNAREFTHFLIFAWLAMMAAVLKKNTCATFVTVTRRLSVLGGIFRKKLRKHFHLEEIHIFSIPGHFDPRLPFKGQSSLTMFIGSLLENFRKAMITR